ncbi:NAD(P)-binding protein, partial [Trichodelitschia bisporula]
MATIDLPATVPTILQPSPDSDKLILTSLPPPTPDEVNTHLLRILATAPCPGELTWASAFPTAVFPPGQDSTTRPLVPGPDLVGIVLSSPADSKFQPGTRVFSRTPALRPGNARKYATAPEHELAAVPEGLSDEMAVATPMGAETGWQGLFVHGGLAPPMESDAEARNKDRSVFVTGASGAVGGWAVQLARAVGVGRIVGVCSGANVDFVKGLGATEVIDYRATSVADWVASGGGKVDLVLDCVGGAMLSQSWHAVRQGGRVVSIVGDPEGVRPEGVGVGAEGCFFIMESVGGQLEEVARLIERGVVRPVVD